MKTRLLLFTALLFSFAISASAQNKELPLLLKGGPAKITQNISAAGLDSFNKQVARFKNKTLAVLQFETLPSEAIKKALKDNGIDLLDYVPQNAYTVSITGKPDPIVLQQCGARALTPLTSKQKLHPALATGAIPNWAVKVPNSVDVQVSFPKMFSTQDVVTALREKNITVSATTFSAYQVLSVRIPANRLEELSALPFILYVQPELPKDQPLNANSRASARGTVLNTSVADGGRGLNGEGIVIGIGDNADVQFHPDFSDRLINRTTTRADYHGTHVHGTAAGAGIINELYRGFAPRATIVSDNFNGILANAPVYVQDYGMVVTNNSYGNVAGCGYAGTYDFNSYILDQQAFDMPYLQHVISAGNSGLDACLPYPSGFHTVLGSYQTAKNVLTVANANFAGTISTSSSRGPVNDGRLKPEITAMGSDVISSVPGNTYGYNSGTSMSAPAVTGGYALLCQRYRQLNNGATPKNGLLKALLCNGATDKGNPGPDFTYGFGFMNLERSVTMLENNQYVAGMFTNGASKNHQISVPANTAQLKVMLYWNDPAPAYVSSRALVNDLDLKVTTPASATVFPKILNASPGSLNNPAIEGADHLNNIEQVVIDNPTAGIYTANIQGMVAQNPSQEYYVVYDLIPVTTQLVYPTAGTVVKPGEALTIAWDSYGSVANTFSLEYSMDNGNTWNTIAAGIDAATRQYSWIVPNEPTSTLLVKLKQDGTSFTSTSAPITVIGVPTVTLNAIQCEGYMNITWRKVTGATGYEVLLLRGTEFSPVGATADTTFSMNSLSKDSTYWVSVRARINGKAGRRSVAIARKPNTGSCAGTISDNDLKINALVAPVNGRKFTSTELGIAPVKVEIKNLDDAPAYGFKVSYKINNRAWVSENVTNSIAPGALYTHTFSTPEDFTALGNYNLVAVVTNSAPDKATGNDTLYRTVRQLGNAVLDLATPFVENMEAAPEATFTTDTSGLGNLERYDFKPAAYGRLRTFVNSGVAPYGRKALALDVDRTLGAGPYPAQYVTGTYNLASYTSTANDIRLEYTSLNNCDAGSAENKVWIRGSDSQPWIELYAPAQFGFPVTSPSIEVAHALAAQGQNFSSSFQIRWGAPSSGQVLTQSNSKGLQLDNIKIYEVLNDMQLVRIDTPYALSCGLSNAVPVTVTLRNNSSSVLTNVPVYYSTDNGATWVGESISSIPGSTTRQYTFTTKANLAAPGVYNIIAVVDYPTDSYPDNNVQFVDVYNSPVTSTFPYLQNFESSDGGWYTDGVNSSWQYGTPASPKINHAASGTKAWKTTLGGYYNDNERSYLYSPCFSIAGLVKPTISFNVAVDLENCGSSICDAAWLEYTVDNKNWYNLADLTNGGTNWYKAPFHAWNVQDYTTWHVASMALPTGYSSIRFRFVLASDEGVTREGIAIDDIHIYDNAKGIYMGASLSAPVTKSVSGNGWIDFESGGKLIASVLPNNQNMGATNVQAFINTGAVRYTASKQYYLDRNITIKPENRSLAAPATVRFYFLDAEVAAMLRDTVCKSCSKITSAFDLGISKYSAVNTTYENGTINDNNNAGTWSFLAPGTVTKVPFDKGYYAEFQVTDFSEFWLNNGGLENNTALPLQLLQFTAKRAGNTVVLDWTTAAEHLLDRYEIELARSTEDLQKGRFQTLAAIKAKGDSAAQVQYTYSDEEPFKKGVRYYRLKMIDTDGAFRYSAVRSVLFTDAVTWQVYPNPSAGIFHFQFQAAAGDQLFITIADVAGRILKRYTPEATGFLQKQVVDLTGKPAGVYLLQVSYNGNEQRYKLYKQ